MKSISTILYFLCSSFAAFSTAQYPDYIVYREKTFALYSNPLEPYFAKHPDRRPTSDVRSSALWRGYGATFEIIENQLVLKDIKIEESAKDKDHEYVWRSVMNEVFPDQPKMKIDWFTGLLVLPYGKLVNYVHMGYGSTYKHYYLLEMKAGSFVRDRAFNHRQYARFKEQQFLAFKKTKEYQAAVDGIKKDGDSDEFIDGFLKHYITEYTSTILVDEDKR